MSAVAAVETPVHAVLSAIEHADGHSHLLAADEQRRWMVWFGLPALVAAFFVGMVFATGQEWYLGLAVSAIVADIGVLIWLCMSSDTNALIGEAPSRH